MKSPNVFVNVEMWEHGTLFVLSLLFLVHAHSEL